MNNQNPFVIVVGLDCMQGIQTARIFAERGVPVIAFAKDPKHHACRTRVCERILYTETQSPTLIEALVALGQQLSQKAVLVPCQDGNVRIVSRYREQLTAYYHIALPAADTVEMLMDKISFFNFAKKAGLATPETYVLTNRPEAEATAEQIGFPCIMKPPSRAGIWSQHTNIKAFKVDDATHLLSLYDEHSPWAESLIVQQWIEGDDTTLYSCNCYFNAGSEPLVTFIARKLRQWPPRTGQSSLGEEVRDDVVLAESLRLFREVNYFGLGYVEIKKDANSGEYFVIEPNIGRPTGRSAIAEAGGVELLYTMYCDLTGRVLPANRKQSYQGVKWVHLRRDTQSVLSYWRDGELTFDSWRESMQGRKGYALWSWHDPLPFFSDIKQTIGLLLSREERKKRGL